MKLRALLPWFLFILLLGCEGPAEKAGADLDAQVIAARQEIAGLKEQIKGYKQTIESTRRDLKDSKEQLALAQQQLAETEQSRQEVLQEMASIQQRIKTEYADTGKQNGGEQTSSPQSLETSAQAPVASGDKEKKKPDNSQPQ